jgi:hypothetical protein
MSHNRAIETVCCTAAWVNDCSSEEFQKIFSRAVQLSGWADRIELYDLDIGDVFVGFASAILLFQDISAGCI